MTGSIPHPLEPVSLIILTPSLSYKALLSRLITTFTIIHRQQIKIYIWVRVAVPMLLLDRLLFSGILSHIMIAPLLAVSTLYLTIDTHPISPLYDQRHSPPLSSTDTQHNSFTHTTIFPRKHI